MEDNEMREVYNPQSGEKVVIKKKPFYQDWKFWLYSVLALFLMIISVSSMVTACSAVQAGVGHKEESSFVQRDRKGAYYHSSYNYPTEPGFIYNYGDYLYINDSFSSPNVITTINFTSAVFRSAYSYQGSWEMDVYKDGDFFITIDVESGQSRSIAISSSSYYWLFVRDMYASGYIAGLEVNRQFGSIEYSGNSIRMVDLENVAQWYASTNEKHWRLISYYDRGEEYYVSVSAFNNVVSGYWNVYVVPGVQSYPNSTYAGNNAVSVYQFPGSTDEDLFERDVSYDAIYKGSVLVNGTLNTVYFDRYEYYVSLGGLDLPDLYQQGYDAGYDEAKDIWYAQGKVDGANSVEPDTLTNTLVAVFQQPFNQIYRFFNFNILGLNILGLATALISVFVIIKVVKKIL